MKQSYIKRKSFGVEPPISVEKSFGSFQYEAIVQTNRWTIARLLSAVTSRMFCK